MASLIRQHDYYYVQFFDANQTPSRKRVALKTTHTKTALRQKSELESRFSRGEYDPWQSAPTMRLGEAVDLFLLSKKNLRKATRDHYRWVLGSLCRHLGPGFDLQSLDAQSLQVWLDASSGNHHTRYTYLTRAGIFVRYLVPEGMVAEDISHHVLLPKPPQRLAEKVLTLDQLDCLVRTARASTVPYIADVAVVAFDLALRLSEVCAMRTDWIDFPQQRLTIKQSRNFSTKSGREVVKPIADRSLDLLEKMAANRICGSHVFLNTKGRPLTAKQTSKSFKKVARAAGLPEAITFHGLRHGSISALVAAGCPVDAVRRFAGHATIDMTMR